MISLAETEAQIARCFDVMSQLRPHLEQSEFVPLVADLGKRFGFRLVFLEDQNGVRAVGGFRLGEWLGGGKYLEVEDLVVCEDARSKGFGGELFDWLIEYARCENCDQVKLVSSVVRFGAHRFYLRKGMIIEAHYFSLKLR